MHFIFSWHPDDDAASDVVEELDQAMEAFLTGESFAKVWPRLYIVRVETAAERAAFAGRVRQNRESLGAALNELNYIVGPAIGAGRTYTGWLEQDLWTEIQRRTS